MIDISMFAWRAARCSLVEGGQFPGLHVRTDDPAFEKDGQARGMGFWAKR